MEKQDQVLGGKSGLEIKDWDLTCTKVVIEVGRTISPRELERKQGIEDLTFWNTQMR